MHPELFRLGPFVVRYYGLMYVIALLLGILLLRLEAKRRGLPPERVVDAAFCAFVSGFVGGRLYYVIFKWGYYSANPLKIFAIWEGGMAIHGGIAGGMLGLWLYARSHGLSVRMLWDMAVPALILGHALGRFGNFMNGDAHGYPLRSPQLPEWLQRFPEWMGVVFPPSSVAGREFGQVALHPVMLYELVLNLFGFVLLWNLRKSDRLPEGGLAGVYLIFYACVRSFTSLFRADDLYLGPLRLPHVVSIVMVAAGLYLLRKSSHRTAAS